jgi:predicted polyphosphate/ATP-dependent NAD kinase
MKIGFLINPVAGMGGKVALKGTDGEETQRLARELGALPISDMRALSAVKEFVHAAAGHEFYSVSGVMGAEVLKENGIDNVKILYSAPLNTTAADDTKRAVLMMLEAGVDLIVFAGGDGTARDICSVVGDKVPVVGIPAGVKIHSGVYAKKPRDAGMLIRNFLFNKVKRYKTAEVVDIDEDAFRQNAVRAKLYGYMKVPDDSEFMQDRKSGSSYSDEDEAADIAGYIAKNMHADSIYLVGSGTTTDALMKRLGLRGTLLGVDAVADGALIGADLTEKQIVMLLESYEREKRHLIITVIGGQGHIFGRGNQQLSPDVLRMIPKGNITVIATSSKMAQLFGKPLVADTGDAALDDEFKGYIPVVTGLNRQVMAKVS